MTQHPNTASGAADLPAIISGALFDFAGFLTTLDKSRAVTFSGAHEAGPAVTLLQEWSTKRGLILDDANVFDWSAALTAQAISKAPDHVAEVGNMVAQAISAEPAGAGCAELPEDAYRVHPEGLRMFDAAQMRDFADRTHAIRIASHGQAPAGTVPDTRTPVLRWIMKTAGAAKEPCGDDPESPAAVRNVTLAAIAGAAAQALGLVRGPSYEDTAPSVLEDAARLDFLIDQRAYVVSDPDACPGHWLHWARPDGSTWVQGDEHPTPRDAIDAARKQGKP